MFLVTPPPYVRPRQVTLHRHHVVRDVSMDVDDVSTAVGDVSMAVGDVSVAFGDVISGAVVVLVTAILATSMALNTAVSHC